MEQILITQDITKTFGGAKPVHALQGVSMSVGRGEIFSLLGPNGAGKTTLIKCLLGIVAPTSGRGEILGHPIGSIKAKTQVGYLPENHRYPLHLTGEQVLDYFGRLSGVTDPVLAQRVTQTLEIVGMAEWRKTRVQKYSKGMMQRLGIAQSLINDPELIVLDEPTDGVDPVGRKEIRDVLSRLRSEGKTIFLNSHLLSEVERVSDRVTIMDHGKVIREGSVKSLTESKAMFQIKVDKDSIEQAQQVLQAKEIDGLFTVHVDHLPELNQLIDTMRSHNIMIESVQPQKSSLEDLFIDLIKSSDLTRQ